MRIVLLLLSLMAIGMHTRAQYVYTINADSVKITNHCDSAELIIQNHTQGVQGGFLYNTGNGRTIFQKALQKFNDSIYLIGPDTLKIVSGSLAPASGSSNYINQGTSPVNQSYNLGTGVGIMSAHLQENVQNTTLDSVAYAGPTNIYRYGNGGIAIDSIGDVTAKDTLYSLKGIVLPYNVPLYGVTNLGARIPLIKATLNGTNTIADFPSTVVASGSIYSVDNIVSGAGLFWQHNPGLLVGIQAQSPYSNDTILNFNKFDVLGIEPVAGVPRIAGDSADLYFPNISESFSPNLTLIGYDSSVAVPGTSGSQTGKVVKTYKISDLPFQPARLDTLEALNANSTSTSTSLSPIFGFNMVNGHTYAVDCFLVVGNSSNSGGANFNVTATSGTATTQVTTFGETSTASTFTNVQTGNGVSTGAVFVTLAGVGMVHIQGTVVCTGTGASSVGFSANGTGTTTVYASGSYCRFTQIN